MTSQGVHPDLRHVPSDVVEAILAALISLEGVQPLDPPELDKEKGSTAEKLRRADANEVISSLLDCEGNWCRITLRRRQQPGDVALETEGPFEIPTGIENVQRLAEGVRVHLYQLYPGFRVRSQDGKVRLEDYSAYVKLERRAEGGERLGHRELERLDALLRTSPDLLGAYRLAADVARGLKEIDRALGYTSRAEKIAPNDPRPLFSRFRAEMAGKRFNAAETTLKRLSILVPDDARMPRARADLLEARGELKKALPLRQEAVWRRPSWPQIVELATLEFRLGASDNARSRLAELLEEQPANQYVRENLALWELADGDLERAASLYEELIRRQPEPMRRYFTNLAFIRYLLGDYAAAETANRQALALDPDNTLTRFNIATNLEAQGKLSEALPLYRTLAEELAATPDLDDHSRMLHAQCLARLGRKDEASGLAEQVLERAPQDFQIFHQAAQIYALLGERLSALYHIDRALKKGVRREWFTIPEFNRLHGDPQFQALVNSSASPVPSSP